MNEQTEALHLHDLLGKANALCRIRYERIEELEAERDKLAADNKELVEALQTGLEYAEEKLIEYDQAYNMHPATKAGRGIITSDIATIRAALEQYGESK